MHGARWIVTCYSNEFMSRLEEMKGQIKSVYGKILKMDSTKKVRNILLNVYCVICT